MIIQINSSDVLFSKTIQDFCKLPYQNHPKGCPNYGKKKGCPPDSLLIDEVLDFSKSLYLIYTEFKIGEFAKKMWKKHPRWSDKMAYNCLFWQPRARKEHREEIERAVKKYKLTKVVKAPEKNGVNVNVLFIKLGIRLEWPPKKITRIASFGGYAK